MSVFISSERERHPHLLHRGRDAAKRNAWFLLAGIVLFLCIFQAECILLPLWLEGLSRIVYRGAFLLIAPARLIVVLFIPRANHHWPLSHFIVSSLLAPYLWWGIASAMRHLFRRLAPRPSPFPAIARGPVVARRQFLVRSAAGMAGIATSGVGSYASLVAPGRLTTRSYELSIEQLPHNLDGLRLVHVSDTHYGPFTSLSFLEEAAEYANNLNGDLVVFTGDYVHFTPLSVVRGIEILSRFRSRLGAVAVMGNHEHWEGEAECRRVFQHIGVPLLDNTRLFLTASGLRETPVSEHSLCLAGVGDLWEDEVSFSKALANVPRAIPRIVLSHNPDTAELLGPGSRVDLMLSGHTHGGQVKLPYVGAMSTCSRYGQKYLGGLCHGPHCPVVVSRGVGMAFLPIRFRVPPEIGLITLRRLSSQRA